MRIDATRVGDSVLLRFEDIPTPHGDGCQCTRSIGFLLEADLAVEIGAALARTGSGLAGDALETAVARILDESS